MDQAPPSSSSGYAAAEPSPPTPIQHSWTGRPADARTERLLANLELITAKAIELAIAEQARALEQLAAPPAKPTASRTSREPDHALAATRLFHLITRAITVEARTAELRRTRDQRDRLAARRAASPAELARRVGSQRSVRTLFATAVAAAGQPLATYQQSLNQRLSDPDIDGLFVDHQAADIATRLCRDLGIPPGFATRPNPAKPPPVTPPPAAQPASSTSPSGETRHGMAWRPFPTTTPDRGRPTAPPPPPCEPPPPT